MRRSTPTSVLAAALLPGLALLLGACGSDSSGGPDDSAPDPAGAVAAADLDGRAFVTTAPDDVAGGDHALVEGTAVRLAFDGDQMAADAGCNHLSGGYAIEGGVLRAGTLAGTEIGCPPDLAAQDAWLAEFLAAGPSAGLDGAVLTLAADGTTVTLTDEGEARPAPPLEGTTWVLDSLVEGRGPAASVSSVPADVRATIRISGGELSIDSGCNTGSARVEVAEDALEVTGLRQTLVACEPGPARVERAVTEVLDGRVGYRLDGDRLVLRSADGQTSLVLVPQS